MPRRRPWAGSQACGSSNPPSVNINTLKNEIRSVTKKEATIIIFKSYLTVGRAIVLEPALAAQLQLDVAHATHAARLFTVDTTDPSLVAGRVGMRCAPSSLVDGARPLEEGLGLGVPSLLAQQVGEIMQ